MFYATISNDAGTRHGFLAGPYHTHGAALAAIPRCRIAARDAAPSDASFAMFGTARVKTAERRSAIVPKLNHLIGYRMDRLP